MAVQTDVTSTNLSGVKPDTVVIVWIVSIILMDQTVRDVRITIISILQQTNVFHVVVIRSVQKVFNVREWDSVNVNPALKDRIVIVVRQIISILDRTVVGKSCEKKNVLHHHFQFLLSTMVVTFMVTLKSAS